MVHEFWPHFGHLIRRAIEKVGISDFALVERDVLSGRDLLWLVHENLNVRLAIVTSLVGETCEIVAIGGENVQRHIHLIAELESYARASNCKSMRIIGRKGWIRLLDNYKQKAIILERPL